MLVNDIRDMCNSPLELKILQRRSIKYYTILRKLVVFRDKQQ